MLDSEESGDSHPATAFGGSRLYFRQLLAGRDFAARDPIARQMVNFVYLIGDRGTGEAVAVDPAYAPEEILEILAGDGMRLSGVLATHYHPDHVGGDLMGYPVRGVEDLLERVDRRSAVPVHVQEEEVPWITRVTGLTRDDLLAHHSGDEIRVGSVQVECVHTPGHTPGSQCFLVHAGGELYLVSGDTLFLEGCGRTDLPGGDAGAMYESLTTRLARVPDDAILFPGHMYATDPSATMGSTRRQNSVFRFRSPDAWLAAFGGG